MTAYPWGALKAAVTAAPIGYTFRTATRRAAISIQSVAGRHGVITRCSRVDPIGDARVVTVVKNPHVAAPTLEHLQRQLAELRAVNLALLERVGMAEGMNRAA